MPRLQKISDMSNIDQFIGERTEKMAGAIVRLISLLSYANWTDYARASEKHSCRPEESRRIDHRKKESVTLSALPLTSGVPRILLQKSFGGDERNFLGPLMRFARRDVGDHVAYQKNDHEASYQSRGALQR
jgi:hypothetical protein